jgi:hypothetical protein
VFFRATEAPSAAEAHTNGVEPRSAEHRTGEGLQSPPSQRTSNSRSGSSIVIDRGDADDYK